MLLLKTVAIWAAFIPLAILNGLAREYILVSAVGPRLALPLSGVLGAGLFFLLVYMTLPWLALLTRRGYALVGIAWLVMTVSFEFLFGRLVAQKSWGELLGAYDLTTGNLWLVMLLVIALSPVLVARWRGLD